MDVLVIFLLCAHFVADFCFQTQEMAQEKSKSLRALFDHVWVYTAVIMVLVAAFLFAAGLDVANAVCFAGINGVVHFGIDYVTSRINRILYEAKETHWFFVGIGFDQLLHTSILVGTASMLLK